MATVATEWGVDKRPTSRFPGTEGTLVVLPKPVTTPTLGERPNLGSFCLSQFDTRQDLPTHSLQTGELLIKKEFEVDQDEPLLMILDEGRGTRLLSEYSEGIDSKPAIKPYSQTIFEL